MIILTIRTDKPEAEIGLYQDNARLAYETWEAHRELGRTLHVKLEAMLRLTGKTWQDVTGLIAFKGPGSFTGLRIGLTVADSLAYSLPAAIIGASGEDWIEDGLAKLLRGESDGVVLPEYGAEANITAPRK